MKLLARRLLLVGAPLLITACATMGPPLPPSLELPKPPSDLRAVRKGNRVMLTWTSPSTTTDRQTVRRLGPTRICRGLEAKLAQCGTPVGEVVAKPSPSAKRQKVAGSYTDSLPEQIQSENPSAFITYAIEVLNTDGRGAGLSNRIQVSLVRTPPPPREFTARVTSQGVVLNWIGDVPPVDSAQAAHYVYRVYRRAEGSSQQTLAGQLSAASEQTFSLTDSSIEWEKSYEYRAETVTIIAQENKPEAQIEGEDTPVLKIFTHDVFPPAVPSGLQAVFSGPGQQAFIDLIWAPVTDVDLDGYNVYRHEEGAAAVKVNGERLKTPAYRDASVASGKIYFYSVSAVDVRGNESARSEEASEAVP